MSTENQNNIPEEIDLGIFFKKINSFFSGIAFSIFKTLLFFKKNSILFLSLIIIGGVGGYFLDYENNSYDNNVIVIPNIGSIDYLYSKIDLLESKLKEGDKSFFNSIGIAQPEKLSFIEIEPIIDIYEFVNNNTVLLNNAQNTQNFELMKLLSESSDINKVIKDKVTSKNYPNHNIHIITSSKTNLDEVINPILKFLNKDVYFEKVAKITRDNINIKMEKDSELISQTDSIINSLSKNSFEQKGSNSVYNNDNNQISSLFEFKNSLINEIANKKLELVNLESFIKDKAIFLNIKNTKGTNGKMKFLLPILMIFLYIFYISVLAFYRKQSSKLNK